MMETVLHDAHNAQDATGDTCDATMLRCTLTILPDVQSPCCITFKTKVPLKHVKADNFT